MLNIAVIDDEALSRHCILSYLGFFSHTFTVLIEAEHGQEALQKFKKTIPDIIIVDIRMPGMNGLQLIDTVRKHINPSVKSIIISGFDDNEYFQEAIQLKVCDYLLKPIKKHDILATVSKAIKELQNDHRQKLKANIADDYLIGQQLSDFIHKKNYDRDQVLYLLQSSLTGKYPCYLAIVIRLIRVPVAYQKDSQSCYGIVKMHCSEILSKKYPYIVFGASDNLYTAFVNIKNASGLDHELYSLIQSFNMSNFDISIGIGTLKNDATKLADSFNEALGASRTFFVEGPNKFYYYQNTNTSKSPFPDEIYRKYSKQVLFHLAYRKSGYIPLIRSLLEIEHYKSFSNWERALDIFTFSLLKLMYEYNVPDCGTLDLALIKDTSVSIDDIVEKHIIPTVSYIADYISLINGPISIEGIDRALNYINEHYTEELTLESVAALANISTNYFCEAFKKATGKTFIEYVTRLRIEQSKKLLTDTSLLVREIAEVVGYYDVNYFRRVFKRAAGMEPNKYRRNGCDCI